MQQRNDAVFLSDDERISMLAKITALMFIDDEIVKRVEIEEAGALTDLLERRKNCVSDLACYHGQLVLQDNSTITINDDEVKKALYKLQQSSKHMQQMIDTKSKLVLEMLQRLHKQHYYNQ
jgi:hypothetical protein